MTQPLITRMRFSRSKKCRTRLSVQPSFLNDLPVWRGDKAALFREDNSLKKRCGSAAVSAKRKKPQDFLGASLHLESKKEILKARAKRSTRHYDCSVKAQTALSS